MRMTIAPTVAPMKSVPCPAWYQPMAWPTYVATKAPPIPSNVVITKPMFSRPGWMSFATTPTTNPTMMVQMSPMQPPWVAGSFAIR